MNSVNQASPDGMYLRKGACEECRHCGGWLADCWAGVWRYDRRVWCIHRASGPGKGTVQVDPERGCAYWERAPDPDDYPII